MSNNLYWQRPGKRKTRNSVRELGEPILDESTQSIDEEIEERESYDSEEIQFNNMTGDDSNQNILTPAKGSTIGQAATQEHLSDSLWNFILRTKLDKIPMAVDALKEYSQLSNYDLEDILADFDNEAAIDYMQYEDNGGLMQYVKDRISVKKPLTIALKYPHFLKEKGETIWNDPTQWDSDNFTDFRRNNASDFVLPKDRTAPSKSPPGPTGTDEEKELYRRLCATAHKLADMKVPTLARDEKYVDWNEKWLEKLKPYGLDVMFQPGFDHTTYTNDTQKKILEQYRKVTAPLLRQAFMTDYGKQLIQQGNENPDIVFWKHDEYQTTSVFANEKASGIRDRLSALRIEDRTSTRVAFINSLVEEYTNYDKISPLNKLSDQMKIDYLKDAIQSDDKLFGIFEDLVHDAEAASIKTNTPVQPIVYKEFYTCLLSQARVSDTKEKKLHSRATRKVNAATLARDDGEYNPDSDISSNSDLPELTPEEMAWASSLSESTSLDINMATAMVQAANWQKRKERAPGTDIPHDLYKSLDRDFKKAWQKVSDEDKRRILNTNGTSKLKNADLQANVAQSTIQPDLQAKVAQLEQQLYTVQFQQQHGLSNYGMQTSVPFYQPPTHEVKRTLTWGEMCNQAPQTAIVPVNKSAQTKQLKSALPQGAPARVLANNNTSTLGINANTVIEDNRPPGQTEVKFMRINKATFHSCKEHDDMINIKLHLADSSTVTYRISKGTFTDIMVALMDGGASGGLGGTNDSLAIKPTGAICHVEGIDQHLLQNIEIWIFATLVRTSQGPRIGMENNYARITTQKTTIHSKVQLEAHGNLVYDTPKVFGGKQCLITPCGCYIPLIVKGGLCYIEQRKPTWEEFEKHPKINLTCGTKPWDPSVFDCKKTSAEYLDEVKTEIPRSLSKYDAEGNYIISKVFQKNVLDSLDKEIVLCPLNPPDQPSPLDCLDLNELDKFNLDYQLMYGRKAIIPRGTIPDGEELHPLFKGLSHDDIGTLMSIKAADMKFNSSTSEEQEKSKPFQAGKDFLEDPEIVKKIQEFPFDFYEGGFEFENEQTLQDDCLEIPEYEEYFSSYIPTERDIIGTVDSEYFDVLDNDPTRTTCFAYEFHPMLDVDAPDDLPQLVSDTLIQTKYACTSGSDWQELLMDRVSGNQQALDEYCKYYVQNLEMQNVLLQAGYPKSMKPAQRDYDFLRRFFGGLSADTVKKTFAITNQHLSRPPATRMEKNWKSHYPFNNCRNRDEHDYLDMIISKHPAVFGGESQAMFFTGSKTKHCAVYKMKDQSGKSYIAAAQDRIRDIGRPIGFRGDKHPTYYGYEWIGFLRDMLLSWWSSEPHIKHMQKGERYWRTLYSMAMRTMDRTGAPPNFWFLALALCCIIWNCAAVVKLSSGEYTTPHALSGLGVPDISPLCCFEFYQDVYYIPEGGAAKLPDVKERRGKWVGISPDVGTDMTWKIIDDITGKEHWCSLVRPVNDLFNPNKRADTLTKEDVKLAYPKSISPAPIPESVWTAPLKDEFLTSASLNDGENILKLNDLSENGSFTPGNDTVNPENPGFRAKSWLDNIKVPLTDADGNPKVDETGNPIIANAPNPLDLKGRYFLTPENNDGFRERARIVGLVEEDDDDLENYRKTPSKLQFKIAFDEEEDREDILTYNDILNCIERENHDEDGTMWKFRRIIGHEHTPLGSKNRMHSEWNVIMEWEDGSVNPQPLTIIGKDSPVECAQYAIDNDLLDKPGWRKFKRLAKREKMVKRLLKQAKLRSFRTAPRYKFGYLIPNSWTEAKELDKRNGNKKWAMARKLEMDQIKDFQVFIDKGKFAYSKIPRGYTLITAHLIFDVKHDGRHKARFVANGNLTKIGPLDSVYAGVVSMRGLRTCLFLAELNDLTAWTTDIGNAFLNATTTEKVCIRAGPEFGELENHLLLFYKSCYGLKTSGARFTEMLSKYLREEMGFTKAKVDDEIYFRISADGTHYEYLCTYIDDLLFAVDDPELFLKQLQDRFTLKGSTPTQHHLGCDFDRDEDGTLYMDPSGYIDRMEESYIANFGSKPSSKGCSSPLEKGDHPELDTSAFLEEDDIEIYQSLIGSIQWAVTLGRFDINTAVMSMSSFRAKPRQGHLERLKRMIAYLCKFKHFKIRFRTEEPDYSMIEDMSYNWANSVYGNPIEEKPKDAPIPLGKSVTITSYFDANLMHDVLSGKAVTGILHLLNKTPIDWYSKKQGTSECATYSAEYSACRTCIEQIVDLRNTLRYLGVNINEKTYIFGDNESMIKSSTVPFARLHKRHNILSYHYVRSQIAAGYINLVHIPSEFNASDVLSKHWGYQQVWKNILQPLLHFHGDFSNVIEDDDWKIKVTKILQHLLLLKAGEYEKL